MEKTLFEKIVAYLSNYFELFIYVNASLAALFFAVFVAVKLSDPTARKLFHSTVRNVLFTIIIGGQVIFFMLLVNL